MHGRLKVRTTAQQEEAKRKERAVKTKKYLAARSAIGIKRAQGGVDEEVFGMITKLLTILPDFGTLWNWRREGFEQLWKTYSEDELQKDCEQELNFLNSCLQVNPKSYGVWHQRRWVMLHAPKPPWDVELSNCGQFLMKDSRNFHCWDYRRFVVKHSGKIDSNESEFKYTLDKLEQNFSNYSAWHYRTTLLPKVHPGEDSAVDADILKDEFELCTSAFFIDCCDQSAWFYHRWLLGREDTLPTPSAVVVEGSTLKIILTQPAKLVSGPIIVTVNGVAIQTSVWSDMIGNNRAATVWQCTMSHSTDTEVGARSINIKFQKGSIASVKGVEAEEIDVSIEAQSDKAAFKYVITEDDLRSGLSRYCIPSKELLEEQLESCEELLSDLEGTEKKWALLAIVYIMRGLSPAKYRETILDHLNVLGEIDARRKGYYSDISSRYKCEDLICDNMSNPPLGEVTMTELGLTSVHHLDHLCMVQSLSLANNNLLKIEGVGVLKCLRRLVLDDNSIKGIYGEQFHGLDVLEEISLKRNKISSKRGLSGLTAAHVPSLKSLWLEGNPVCQDLEFDSISNLITATIIS